MTFNIAINGFGRIGRNVLRALNEGENSDINIVAINDLAPTATLAHLFKYDSVHGRYEGKVTHTNDSLDIGQGPIIVSQHQKLKDLDWAALDIDIVLECTGLFTSRETASKHIKAGAKRVLISAPGKNVDKTIVYGINCDQLTKNDLIISNASCTTNALAPVAKVLNDNFEILSGFMSTVHAYTGDQPTLDTIHRDVNRGRAACLSMVPTSTGAAKALGLVLPELDGKLDGRAIRVPTPNVSVVDLTVMVKEKATVESVNATFQNAAEGPLKGILQTINTSLVSIDLNHDPHSTSFVNNETVVVNDHMIRVLSWYDNEWGFSNRMLDVSRKVAAFL